MKSCWKNWHRMPPSSRCWHFDRASSASIRHFEPDEMRILPVTAFQLCNLSILAVGLGVVLRLVVTPRLVVVLGLVVTLRLVLVVLVVVLVGHRGVGRGTNCSGRASHLGRRTSRSRWASRGRLIRCRRTSRGR